jgi:hypothetical protein
LHREKEIMAKLADLNLDQKRKRKNSFLDMITSSPNQVEKEQKKKILKEPQKGTKVGSEGAAEVPAQNIMIFNQMKEGNKGIDRGGVEDLEKIQDALFLTKGAQEKLLKFLIKLCSKNNKGYYTTPVSSSNLSEILGLSQNLVKTSIARLKKKELIGIHSSVRGKFTRFFVSKKVQEMI